MSLKKNDKAETIHARIGEKGVGKLEAYTEKLAHAHMGTDGTIGVEGKSNDTHPDAIEGDYGSSPKSD